MAKIAGIILAAGYSSRMSALKALYPIGARSVLEQAVNVLQSAGTDSVHVVTGYRRELLEQHLSGLESECSPTHAVYNRDYDSGMYSSVLAGLGSLPPDTDGFLLLPVDCPFVQPSTIKQLCAAFDSSDADIISPVHLGRAGHPPLIRRTVFESIKENSGAGGLRAVLADQRFTRLEIETGDQGMLDDIDDDSAYQRLLEQHCGIRLNYPDREEVQQILEDSSLAPGLIAHMEKVNELAVGFCERLNAAGAGLNPGLLSAACRLHDICKGEPEHAAAAAEKLAAMGYPALGGIVAQHMDLDYKAGAPLDEAALLYLADKMTEGDTLLELSDRMAAKLDAFSGNSEAIPRIRERFERAFILRARLEAIIGPLV